MSGRWVRTPLIHDVVASTKEKKGKEKGRNTLDALRAAQYPRSRRHLTYNLCVVLLYQTLYNVEETLSFASGFCLKRDCAVLLRTL